MKNSKWAGSRREGTPPPIDSRGVAGALEARCPHRANFFTANMAPGPQRGMKLAAPSLHTSSKGINELQNLFQKSSRGGFLVMNTHPEAFGFCPSQDGI